MKTPFIAVILLIALATQCHAQDWPQWRGANQDNKSTETNLLQSWPAKGPTQLWVSDQAGLGYAGFSIAGEQLFTMGLDGNTEYAICMNANTGKQLWKTKIADRYNNRWGDGPRSTPTVNGEHVYFMAPKGELVCLKLDGSKVWSVSMEDFGGEIPSWGYSESPLVDGDLVVCTPGGSRGAILALNKKTGEKVWQSTELTSQAHYSSLTVLGEGESKAYVQLLFDQIVSVSPNDGTVNWTSEWPGRVAVIPSPVVSGADVYVTSGYGAGSKKVAAKGDQVEEVFYNKAMKNHHGGIVLLDGHIYGHSDRTGFMCQDFESGEMKWNEKKIKKGAVVYADDRFYFIEEGSGDVILIEANPEGWEEQGRFTLSPQTEQRKPDGRIWVHPVIANSKLYLRDQEFIHCYDVSEK